MNLITIISSDPKQTFAMQIDGYSQAWITLEYKPLQNGWFYTLAYGDFLLCNQRMVASLNILRQFKNVIPFGLAITTVSGQDPLLQTDFSENMVSMYLLNSADVAYVEGLYGA